MTSLNTSFRSNDVDVIDSLKEDTQYVWKLLDKLEGDGSNADGDVSDAAGSDVSEAAGSDEDDSELDLDGYITVEESDSSSTSEDSPQSCLGRCSNIKSQTHPRRLDPELWFNVAGEVSIY